MRFGRWRKLRLDGTGFNEAEDRERVIGGPPVVVPVG